MRGRIELEWFFGGRDNDQVYYSAIFLLQEIVNRYIATEEEINRMSRRYQQDHKSMCFWNCSEIL